MSGMSTSHQGHEFRSAGSRSLNRERHYDVDTKNFLNIGRLPIDLDTPSHLATFPTIAEHDPAPR